MTLMFIRVFFLILSTLVGYYVGSFIGYHVQGSAIGFGSGILLIVLESRMRRVSVRGLSSMVFGLLLGFFMAKLLSDIIALLGLGDFMTSVIQVVLTLIFSYLGAVMALRGKDEFNIIIPYVKFKRQDVKEGVILVDTSAIIDGRIADIYKVNFMPGRLVVPRFVLDELQKLSDSADDIKRQRGRRGMELLKNMQNDPKVDVHVHEVDAEEMNGEVDALLMRLAKVMDARICTTDFNLSSNASLQGLDVLNIHELLSAVKSVLFTGDQLDIHLVKEGKEADQAIGYLDDGTMIVVSGGRSKVGSSARIHVTSVLQTQSGKMIFADIVK